MIKDARFGRAFSRRQAGWACSLPAEIRTQDGSAAFETESRIRIECFRLWEPNIGRVGSLGCVSTYWDRWYLLVSGSLLAMVLLPVGPCGNCAGLVASGDSWGKFRAASPMTYNVIGEFKRFRRRLYCEGLGYHDAC